MRGGERSAAKLPLLVLPPLHLARCRVRRVALERGLINCQGKTPEATMASALYTDVKRKHNKSVFTR